MSQSAEPDWLYSINMKPEASDESLLRGATVRPTLLPGTNLASVLSTTASGANCKSIWKPEIFAFVCLCCWMGFLLNCKSAVFVQSFTQITDIKEEIKKESNAAAEACDRKLKTVHTLIDRNRTQ